MPRMGLAVAETFRVRPTNSSDVAVLELAANPTTLRHYPFEFELEITFRLEGNSLLHEFVVENNDDETMYFALGGHPGFRCPLGDGKDRGNYQLTFSIPLSVDRPEIVDSLIQEKRIPYLKNEQALRLDDERVPNGGMFLKNCAARQIGVGLVGKEPYITVDLGDFPNVNLWTPPGMPFACIEPMVAHHDLQNSPETINAKPHLIALPAGESKTYLFTINVGGNEADRNNLRLDAK
jgi:galactose mutarotase-like enzyme